VYLDRTAPWKLKKAGQTSELRDVLANTCEVIRRAAIMVAAGHAGGCPRDLAPDRTRSGCWDCGPLRTGAAGRAASCANPSPSSPTGAGTTERVDRDLARPDPAGQCRGRGQRARPPVAEITIEEFKKMDLRAAKVLQAEAVAQDGQAAQAHARPGWRATHSCLRDRWCLCAADLVGPLCSYLANLKQTKIRGVMSQGMILAAAQTTSLPCVSSIARSAGGQGDVASPGLRTSPVDY